MKKPAKPFAKTKKHCCKCKTWKPVSEFHKNRYNGDGLAYYCKRCNLEKSRASYHRLKESKRVAARKGDAIGKLKLCKRCNQLLPYPMFRMCARSADGKWRRCKLCSVPSIAKQFDREILAMGFL